MQKKVVDKYVKILEKILLDNLNITTEKVLIVGDEGEEDKNISFILLNHYEQACQNLNIKYDSVLIKKVVKGQTTCPELETKIKMLPEQSVIISNTSNGLGKPSEEIGRMRTYFKEKKHKFIVSSSLGTLRNEDFDVYMNCLDIDYYSVDLQTKNLAQILTNADKVHVTTPNGTNLYFGVKDQIAKISTGIYKNPGEGGNLPGSEAYITPYKQEVNGILVVDGSAKVENGTIKIKTPIKITIKDGIIEKIEGETEAYVLQETIKKAANQYENPINCYKICEFGIGTNNKAKLKGATIIDEKLYGTVHFAIGSNNWFGGEIIAPIHLDQVIINPTIKVDGKIIEY